MAPVDYKIAERILTGIEKNRLLACYLSSADMNAVSTPLAHRSTRKAQCANM